MTINALIVEDERPAAQHLIKIIEKTGYAISILQLTDCLESTLDWLKHNPLPELIFLDIQLSDGLSFELFSHTKIGCPVIFTTAYEEYAIRAFKVNSIDYLLKPVNQKDLERALEKYQSINTGSGMEALFEKKMGHMLQMLDQNYKSRFMVNAGLHIRSIETQNIRLFYSMDKSTFLYDQTGKSYDVNYSLDELESKLDPTCFFRVNRKYLIHFRAIKDIITYSSTSLQVICAGMEEQEIIVSRNRIKDFKQWLEQ